MESKTKEKEGVKWSAWLKYEILGWGMGLEGREREGCKGDMGGDEGNKNRAGERESQGRGAEGVFVGCCALC